MQKDKQFRKNFIWNTLGTGFNAFNSLFFLIIVIRINGVDQAGIFSIAFSTACILYAVGLYAGRVYQVTELNKDISDKDFVFNRIITSGLMIVILLIFCIFRSYDMEKFTVFLLLTIYKAIEAFCDVLYGVLQKNDKLDVVGKSLFAKSLASIVIFLIVDLITNNIIMSVISMIAICVLITIIYDFKNTYKYINLKIKVEKSSVIKIFKAGFFVFAISFLGMYVMNAPKYSIDIYLGEDIQTIFGIIVMPATIVSLAAQFLIHPYLNKFVELYKEKEHQKFIKLIMKIVGILLGFGIICALLGYLFGTQVLGFVYGLDLSAHKLNLAIVILAATLYAIGIILSSVLTTVRETKSQFVIYVIVAILATILAAILTQINEIKGAVIAYLLTMVVFLLLYVVCTTIKLKKVFDIEKINE